MAKVLYALPLLRPRCIPELNLKGNFLKYFDAFRTPRKRTPLLESQRPY